MVIKEWFFSWGFVILSGVLDAVAIFMIKHALNSLGSIPFSSINEFVNYLLNLIKSPMAIVGGIGYIASPILWFLAMSRLDITLAYPVIVALHIIVAPLLAILFLGEEFTYSKLIAVLSIIFGVIILYTNKF